jgi:hypothetical protein
VWRSRSQLELAVVEYIGWFNHDRLDEALGDIPPVEFEQRQAAKTAISGNGSVAALSPSGDSAESPMCDALTSNSEVKASHVVPQIASTRLHLSANTPALRQRHSLAYRAREPAAPALTHA